MKITVITAQKFTVSGYIKGLTDDTKAYIRDGELDLILDSAIVRKEKFVLTGSLDETPKMLGIYFKNQKQMFFTRILIGNENVVIKGDTSDFPFDLKITGSASQNVLNNYNQHIKGNYSARNKITGKIATLWNDSSSTAKLEKDRMHKDLKKIDSILNIKERSFIIKNINSYMGLYQLFINRSLFSKDSIGILLNNLKLPYKESLFAAKLTTYIKLGNTISAGSRFYDFEAVDTAGTNHVLSGYTGKYILLEFTLTYCGFCVEAAEELKTIKSLYGDKINLISFWPERSKAIWLKGVIRDKPDWLNLWDGKGLSGDVVLKYGIVAYPSFVLINPDGKILVKKTGYGKGSLLKLLADHVSME